MEGQYTALREEAKLESLVSDKNDGEDKEALVHIAQHATTVQKKSGKPQCLYFLLAIFAIIAIAASIATICLAIILGIRSSQPQTTSSDSNMCLTPGCIQLAAQVTAALNQSVDPCDDFYQFSCGNWEKNNMIPQGNIVQNQFLEPQTTIFQKLIKIIESGNDGGVEAVRKVIDLYQSCMDATTIENLGVTPLLDLIETLGGWSLIGISETSSWSISSPSFFYEKTHGSTAFFNLNPFFNAVTMSRSKYALHFEQQQGTLSKIMPGNITVLKDAGIYILSMLNASVDRTTYDEAVQKILDFDMELSRILVPLSKVPNIATGDAEPLLNQSNIYTLERLQIIWPGFDWQAFITYAYELSGLDVPQNLEIVVTTQAYFQRLGVLLQNTNQEVIRDYAKMFFVINNLHSLSSQFASFRSTTPGNSISCITFIQGVLPIALARPYVEQFVPEGTKENVTMILDYLTRAFRERVSEMNWLSDLSKQRSIEKVDAITSQVAYPAEIFDNDYINGLYATFTATPNDFFGNRLRATELALHLRLNLTYGYDKTQWPTDPAFITFPTLVNAVYSRHVNQMYVMAAIATNPLFCADWPEYFTFGGFGTFVGHEVTHGFDNNGQLFDKDGVRRMWWSTESQTEFQNRFQCFIDQYNRYTFGGIQVNGKGTLSENIADNGGLHASFRAYRMRAEIKPQLRLPSLPYTPDQLFFIAYGQVWCELALPSYYQYLRDNDPHAPGPARANAVVNFQEFAEAFKCPAGSRMNPSNKCIIW